MSDLFKQLKRRIKYFQASLHRRRINQVTFIGITGSAAKTTTTDLAAAILADSGPCQKTHGSNTLRPIAKVLLKTSRNDRYCVAEFGAFSPGSLELPVRLFKPDIAVVTLIGRDHYSAFKSMERIAAEKENVVLALPPEGTAVLNIDDPLVRSIGERCNRRVIWFGEGAGATLRLLEARSRWPEPLTLLLGYKDATYEVRTQLHGTHTAIPILAALGIALAAEIPIEQAIKAIAKVKSPEGRMQVVTDDDGVVFIRDDYKTPGWSFPASLDFLKEAKTDRRVAIVGTISDTSGDNTRNYKKFCRMARAVADLVVFIGPHAHRALRTRKNESDTTIQAFPNIRHAAIYLQRELKKGDLVLLKGSNKADHLNRLILNRTRPIECWKGDCKKPLFCEQCPKLYKPSRATPFPAPMSLPSGPAVPVIVGLGNPGFFNRRTLHNTGYRVLDALLQSTGNVWQVEPEGWFCSIVLGGTAIHLLKPRTSMNNNGAMVRRFLERMSSSPQHCMVVHDDADLLFGDVRFKREGGDAGHKGVRSVIAALGTFEIQRLRLGIGRSDEAVKTRAFVLSRTSMNEEKILAQAIEKASTMIHERFQHHVVDEFIK